MKILLVEDDRAVALAVIYSLKKEGFEVIHSINLKKAREEFNNNKVDLILLDLMLPDGDGYELCTEIREKDKEVPIIFMTACDEEENVILGLNLGADDYVSKPVKIRSLVARINAIMRRKGKIIEEVKEDTLISGNIEVKLLAHIVTVEEKEISLTLSEYKLMNMLMENAPNVLERNLIIEKLWDIEGNFVDANTLSVYMKRLREKIEKDSKNPEYILTIRGVGYKWAPKVVKK